MTPTFPIPVAVKEYEALLTQTGTAAPIAVVVKNTLGGTIVWTRNDTGDYWGTLTGAFPADKTVVMMNNTNGDSFTYGATRATDNRIDVRTSEEWVRADEALTNTAITIKVYN